MSVAELRFNPDKNSAGGAHLETKSGSYIYYGDAASFHDWEFRTRLRIRLWNEGNKRKNNSRRSAPATTPKKGDMPNGGTEEDAELPGFPLVDPEDEEEEEESSSSSSQQARYQPAREQDSWFAWRCLFARQGHRS